VRVNFGGGAGELSDLGADVRTLVDLGGRGLKDSLREECLSDFFLHLFHRYSGEGKLNHTLKHLRECMA
jgi:hypothetical protein